MKASINNVSSECYVLGYRSIASKMKSQVMTDSKGRRTYYSYRTVVGFYTEKTGIVCHTNDWNTTTGRHLNCIESDHKKRLDSTAFKKAYNRAFKN